ncbi:MAG: YegS/Rv2252/BmrU family lipid kinase [Gemmatimonadota bacterium]|nr:YegS/Rv2252/BmrU family lipid kinase [Gemmatimonadota bacterium]
MPRKKHIVLVVHGARADRPDLRHMVSWVRDRGHLVQLCVTWDPGDAEAFAADAADRGVDVVVAVGGDGTLNAVVNGLDGRDTALGVVPLGTANDFARQVGIPPDADHAMDVVLLKEPLRMDTASLNGRRFINVSSGGVGAEATAETPTQAKATLGALAYAITGVRKIAGFAPYRGRFRGDAGVDGEDFALDGEFLLFGVGNGRATGAGTLITPQASVTDGLVDVCVVEAMPRREFGRLLLKFKRGEQVGQPGVHYARVRSLLVEADAPLSVNVDGEHATLERMEYRARPGDLRVHAAHLPGEEPAEG